MASFNNFILAFFMALALVFSSINVGLAARRLQQTPPSASIPTQPQHTIPTLPTTQPTMPQPGELPPLPSIPITLPHFPQLTFPPLPSIASIPHIPFPFFSPPPATTNP